MARRTVITQLTTAGEEALGRIAQNPVTHKALEGALQVKERVEKVVSNLADIDGRVRRIEKRLDALEKSATPAKRRTRSTSTKTTAKPRATSAKKKPTPSA